MMQYALWILGLLSGYMILRRMFQVEVTQQKILTTHTDLKEWLDKVHKDNVDLLSILQSISTVQSSIVSQIRPVPPAEKKVIKAVRKKRSYAYTRTPEFKKKMSDLTRERWAKKKGHIAPMAPVTQETGAV